MKMNCAWPTEPAVKEVSTWTTSSATKVEGITSLNLNVLPLTIL